MNNPGGKIPAQWLCKCYKNHQVTTELRQHDCLALMASDRPPHHMHIKDERHQMPVSWTHACIKLLLNTCSALLGCAGGYTLYFKLLNALLYIDKHVPYLYMLHKTLARYMFGTVWRLGALQEAYTLYFKLLHALWYIYMHVLYLYMLRKTFTWYMFSTVRRFGALYKAYTL